MKSHAATLDMVKGKCGYRPALGRGSYRIVGGQIAQKHSWPWQVIETYDLVLNSSNHDSLSF